MNISTSKISLEAALVLAGVIGSILLFSSVQTAKFEPGSIIAGSESAAQAYNRWVIFCSPVLMYVVGFLLNPTYARSQFGKIVFGVLVGYAVIMSYYLHINAAVVLAHGQPSR